jgi:hypothetical protein
MSGLVGDLPCALPPHPGLSLGEGRGEVFRFTKNRVHGEGDTLPAWQENLRRDG